MFSSNTSTKKSRPRPSATGVLAVIALVMAMAGGAVALPGKNKVDKGDLQKGAVTKKAIKKSAVTTAAIRKGAVKSISIVDAAVDSAKLANDAVTTQKVADSAVTSAKIKDGEVSAADIAPGVVPSVPQMAYGRVNKTGGTVDLVAGGTGIVGATNNGGGIVCYDLAFAPVSGTATVVHESVVDPGSTVEILIGAEAGAGCDAKTVTKRSTDGALADEDVYVQFIK